MARKLAIALVALGLAAGLAVDAHAQKKGGILRVGIIGEPPALDAHWTTATLTSNMSNHLYEGLYTLDDNRRPVRCRHSTCGQSVTRHESRRGTIPT